jgi:hypothetical protein
MFDVAYFSGNHVAVAYRDCSTMAMDPCRYSVWVTDTAHSRDREHPGACIWSSEGVPPLSLRWRTADSLDVIAEDPDSRKSYGAHKRTGFTVTTVLEGTSGKRP